MMHKEIIKQVVLDQAEESRSVNSLVSRDVYSTVEEFVNNKQVIILSGIRRCGKSTLMNLVRHAYSPSNYYINFDDDRLVLFELTDFDRLIEVFFELYGDEDHFYFDEIQNIVGWERFVRRLHNAGKKVFITGSNANLLSRELGTHLTGRFISVELYPFSFREFILQGEHHKLLTKKNWTSADIIRIKKDFSEYKIMGGLPEYLESGQKQYLHSLYESILYKDIIVRHKLMQEKAIKDTVYYLASNNTKLFSYNGLRKTVGLASASTVSDYCDFLENSYLCFELSRFSYSVKKQIQVAKKIYFVDHALAESIGFRFSEERGRTLENIVFMELKRRGYEIYFHQEKKECDFLIRDGFHISQAIQVSDNLMDSDVRQREFDGLVEAMSAYNLSSGLIITDNEEGDEVLEIGLKKYHIQIVPCWKWLLMKIDLYEKDESLHLK